MNRIFATALAGVLVVPALAAASGPAASPQSAAAELLQGRALRESGRQAEALSHYRSAYRRTSGGARAPILLEIAQCCLEMSYYPEAAGYARLLLRLYPAAPEVPAARLLLARSLSASGRGVEALDVLDGLSGVPEAEYCRANTLQRMGRTLDAARAYARAEALDPDYIGRSEETRCLLGENLLARGERGRARQLLLTVTGDRHAKRAAAALGAIALADGSADEAATRLSAALGSPEMDVRRRALLALAEALLARGDARGAAARLSELAARHPNTPEAAEGLVRLFRIRRDAGADPAQAAALLRAPLREPGRARESAIAEAVALIDSAARDKALLSRVWDVLGRHLTNAASAETLLRVAAAVDRLGDRAAPLHERISRFGPAQARAASLSWLASRATDASRAREYVERGRQAGLRGDDLRRIEARAALASNDPGVAAAALLSLGRPGKDDLPALREILPYAPDRKRAAALFAELVARHGGDAEDLALAGDIWYARGRRREALAAYRAALAKDPSSEWAALRAALLLGPGEGDEFLGRIRSDRLLARFAAATRRDWALGRGGALR